MTYTKLTLMSDNSLHNNPHRLQDFQVLQLNTRRSSTVIHSLLNDPVTSSFHFLLLQEPYIYPSSNSPITHPSWVPFLTATPDCSAAPPEDSTIKSLIYVNKCIPTTALTPLNTSSNCIAALTFSFNEHLIILISAYAPPNQAHKLDQLRHILRANPSSPTKHLLVGMDSNLHHPLWNPPSYKHTHREAESLLITMLEVGLSLQSTPGIPTFYPPQLSHANTTIDLVWISPTCYDWAVCCVTDVDLVFSHLSDHAAITTTIHTPSKLPVIERADRNWKKLDSQAFKQNLAVNLTCLLPTLESPATLQEVLDLHTSLLTDAVTTVMDCLVPRLPRKPGAKRWWDKDLLNPLKANAQGLRRLYQRRRDEPSRLAYLAASHTYREAIYVAKRQHWRSFLDSLTPSTLFTASKYATSSFAAPSLTVPPLRTASGELSSNPEVQAELLFQGTSTPKVLCELDDLLPPDHHLPTPTLFTPHELSQVIDNLKPGKAPGSDEITNQAIQAGGKTLLRALRCVANSCLLSGLFPSQWKVARTAILRKPHKPDYANPSAYRPIALLSCMGKVVDSVIANRFKSQAEASGVLPPGHYGGRPQCSTEDALTHLTAWTKNQWSKGKSLSVILYILYNSSLLTQGADMEDTSSLGFIET